MPNAQLVGNCTIGPSSPTLRTGETPEALPFKARIEVVAVESGRIVSIIETDDEGQFDHELPAGRYVLRPISPQPGAPPYAEEMELELTSGETQRVEVRYQSGIR